MPFAAINVLMDSCQRPTACLSSTNLPSLMIFPASLRSLIALLFSWYVVDCHFLLSSAKLRQKENCSGSHKPVTRTCAPFYSFFLERLHFSWRVGTPLSFGFFPTIPVNPFQYPLLTWKPSVTRESIPRTCLFSISSVLKWSYMLSCMYTDVSQIFIPNSKWPGDLSLHVLYFLFLEHTSWMSHLLHLFL